jgi:hypothetical protein
MLVDHFAGVGKVLIDAGADVNLWEHKVRKRSVSLKGP